MVFKAAADVPSGLQCAARQPKEGGYKINVLLHDTAAAYHTYHHYLIHHNHHLNGHLDGDGIMK